MSFADSLKNTTSKSADSAVALTSEINENISIAAYSLDDNISLLSEDDSWIKPDNANLYIYYNNEYYDDSLSTVDKNKNITLSSEQINLTQEKNSQYIPFEIPRYYDGFDLSKTEISIYWVNKNGSGSTAIPVDVYYNSNKIRFAWLIDDDVTALAGNIEFEIHAEGENSQGFGYLWKTKSNNGLNVIQALEIKSFIEPDDTWQESFIQKLSAQADKAIDAKNEAIAAMEEAKQIAADLQDGISDEVQQVIADNYYTKSEVDTAISNVEVDLTGYYTKNEVYTKGEVDSLVNAVDDNLTNYYTKEETYSKDEVYTKEGVDTKLENIDLSAYYTKTEIDTMFDEFDISDQLTSVETSIDNINTNVANLSTRVTENESDITGISNQISSINTDLSSVGDRVTTVESDVESLSTSINNVYTKEETDNLLETKANSTDVSTLSTQIDQVESTANTNKTDISTLSQTVVEMQEQMSNFNTDPSLSYRATYNTETGMFSLIELEGEEEESQGDTVSSFIISGGSGGGSTSTTVTIERITSSPLVVTKDDNAVIEYKFTSLDSSGDDTGEGTATWKVNGSIVATSMAIQGLNYFDLTKYVTVGTNKIVLSVTDAAGTISVKNWTIQVVDVRLESSFDDTYTYPIGDIEFTYTPYGSIEKTVHFILDGEEIGTVTTSVSGVPMSYTLPSQSHGSHLLDVYITAEINGTTIETNHIYKDILWYDETSDIPVIGCITQSIVAMQYDNINIVYTVYDPKTETPNVILAVDDNIVSNLTLDTATNTWQYKSSDVGEHVLTITCRDTVKTINVTIEELNIDISPVTAGLAFDFNPYGYSNNDANRLWTDGTTSMTVSDNFDWINGGYQIDENGDQYFCIKAGTSAVIDYKLFEDDAKKNGKEFKLVFKTTNVRKADATFLTCVDGDTSKIGLQMNVHEAYVYASAGSLYLPYSENDIIEFEFNIYKNTDALTIIRGYEDGVPSRPMVYTDSHNFTQTNPKYITIGSEDCDVYIYRCKAYSTALTNKGVLNNFIADARNADEMIARYNRNQIFNENGQLTPESVAEACPSLKVIKLDCPHFTNDKKDFVKADFQFIHKGGDPVLDNYQIINGYHSGQGTTSNEYGEAARNMDLIFCFDGVYTNSKIPFDENYKTKIIFGDGTTYEDGTGKITLTRTSVPTNYLNVKVNVASSEHSNNSKLQKRFNEFLPYTSLAQKNDSRVKNSMEFVNCVVFIRENDPDLTTHREFQDTEWHFYSIGNVGDSKKTDYTRVNDATDPNEFVVEIMDNTFPNSTFSGTEEALAALDADQFDEDGTYGFRYEMDGIRDDQQQKNMEVWREFYRFVVNSTDEEFVNQLNEWFIVDSALYFYLFTERYTMIDNRAKNTFWHFGKTGEYHTVTNPKDTLTHLYCELINDEYVLTEDTIVDLNKTYYCQYAFDFWDYDNDTALGINNSGELTMTYGKEDVDYRTDGDASSGYIFNAAESTFFRKIRNLMYNKLCEMFLNRESVGCWSATGLINEFDESQSQFPEELWIAQTERVYERTFKNGSTRFLAQMDNGRKKYQRRQFERDQEPYMASKYFGTTATSNQIMFRCNTPQDAVVAPDYTLHLTPYSDMYLSVMFGATYRTQIRAKAGQAYDIECPFTTMDDTAVLIYNASLIQAIGDLSGCYIHDNDFSKAEKLKVLIIGNDTEGYQNTFLTNLGIGNNTLLEKLDIQNTPNLVQALDLSKCENLAELYAHGSGLTGVTFASGGKIQIAELPAITAMTLKELLYLTNLDITSFDNLTTLIIENCSTVDVKSILEQAQNVNRVRITGIDWNLDDTTLLQDIYNMYGIDNNGYNITQSVLFGNVFVPVIRQQELREFNEAWQDLDITYNTLIEQYAVTFKNEDGTILDVQYVDKGGDAVDPITREENPIDTPTKENSVEYTFTFNGWDLALTSIFSDRVITATYTSALREYTITYKSKGVTLQTSTGLYGENIPYTGDIPVYTLEESAYSYYLFTGWDKSGIIDGEKVVNAVFDSCTYNEGYFEEKDLSTLRPVEVYAMTKLGLCDTYIEDKDSITLSFGNDYNYDDVESIEIISEKTVFNGTNYVDSGITLLDEDRDFVIAIDYKLSSDTATSGVLAQCFQSNGSNGFKLWNNNGAKITWGTTTDTASLLNKREMIVLRHIKGETGLHVYNSNLDSTELSYIELERTKETVGTSTLVFGCQKADDGYYENYAVGEIHWVKVWYTDLGDNACRELAAWTHEKLTMEAFGVRRYYLSDNSGKRTSVSFLAAHLLDRDRVYTNVSTNSGGWANSTLNTFMNSRMYNAIELEWRQLIKQVKVPSSIGDTSTEISESDCYLTIPAVIEVDATMTSDPYMSEGSSISFMTTNDSRIRSYDSGDVGSYWTRSPNVRSSNYCYRVDTDGKTYGYTYPNNAYGILVELSI